MLDNFVVEHRSEIISRTKARATIRTGPMPDLPKGIPAFLDQLVTALRLADATDKIDHDQIRKSAAKQGDTLYDMGLSVDEVVHQYGDVCQIVTELAIAKEVRVPTAEFRVMNLCLDDAIAEAVTKFAGHRQRSTRPSSGEGLGKLVHEMRTLLGTARTSLDMIQSGRVGTNGSTARVLDRALQSLRDLVERGLTDESSQS
ncbi:MAG: hypothetical protein ABIY55_11305 [Kofleriaceae bacterium]